MVRRRAIVALAALAAVLPMAITSTASPAGAAPTSPEPEAWIIADADTGTVLAAKDPHTALPPASTAKVMTALTAVERLPEDGLIPVSELAASQPASKITMLAGEQWPFDQALASLLMVSANDAAYAIAEATSGSLEGFADALAATAARLGMNDSTFSDPAGFDDAASFRGGPRMSAFDIAVATRNALAVPQLAYLAALPELDFTDPSGMARNLVNHNKLLAGGAAEYAGATGFKTGYTQQAGHTLIATATREGRTIIVVILDTYDTYGWAWQLLDQGFAIPSGDPGTGEELPEVRVSPFAERQADQLAFLRLTHGAAGADAAAAIESAEPTTTVTPATDAAGDPIAEGGATEPSAASSTPASATSASPAGDGADSGGSRGPSEGSIISLRNFVLLIVLMLATLFVLRRRAVRRQRARRLARRRATAEMMRRGGLPVVDGRYRTGTRIGPPVQSNIKVERIDPRTGPARGARSTPRGGS